MTCDSKINLFSFIVILLYGMVLWWSPFKFVSDSHVKEVTAIMWFYFETLSLDNGEQTQYLKNATKNKCFTSVCEHSYQSILHI